ncbi:MAG TPA: ABC transporter permease [Clostridiales bacterium]|nr:ABC transporter permease [Clostridiales bacterium]
MKKAFYIAGLTLLQTKKDRLMFMLMIGLAIFFTFIMSMAFGGRDDTPVKIPVAVVDNDRSDISREIISRLERSGLYEMVLSQEEIIYDYVRDREVEVGFIIPKGFGQSVEKGQYKNITMVRLEMSSGAGAITKEISRVISSFAAARTGADIIKDEGRLLSVGDTGVIERAAQQTFDTIIGELREPKVTGDYRYVTMDGQTQQDYKPLDHSSIGFMLMFTMFTVLFSAGDILEERKTYTWYRLMSTPTAKGSIIGGKLLGIYLIGCIQILILILAGRFLFNVNYGPSLAGVIALMAVFLLSVLGLGFMLAALVKTTGQLQALAPIIIVGTSMIGGCFWPLEVASPSMQSAARFSLQGWAITGLTQLMTNNAGVGDVRLNILVLLGFSAAFFAVTLLKLKYEYR